MTAQRPITAPDFAALMRRLTEVATTETELTARGVGIMMETLGRNGFGEGVDIWARAMEPRR